MEDDATQDVEGNRQPLGAELIIPGLALALVAYYVVSTDELAWEAKATGVLVGVVLSVLCSVHLIRVASSVVRGKASLRLGALVADTPDNRKRLGLVVLTSLFIGTIGWVGTTLGLFVLLISLMLLMGVRELKTLFLVAFCTTATVYVLLIYLLGSKLPAGVIEKSIAALTGGGA